MADFSVSQIQENFQKYENDLYRMVEGQHFISTRRLVDTDDEQEVLELLIDETKPFAPIENSRGKLHYLLFTPFRYPPLKDVGRFHVTGEQSIFYCSENLNTVLAEIAYRRFIAIMDSEAELEPSPIPYTHFKVKVSSAQAILLNKQPFEKHRGEISNPTSYAYSQPLGATMRKAGAELFTFHSARCVGLNVGLFSVDAFKINHPIQDSEKHWTAYVSPTSVEFKRARMLESHPENHKFNISDFFVNDNFPMIS